MNYQLCRAAIEQLDHHSFAQAIKDWDLIDRAHQRLEDNLTSFGNGLTNDHRRALLIIVTGLTHLANGTETGRYCFPLPCGGGKTQAIVAWASALHELKKPYSLAISASKVEALCDLKRDLIANGVPETEIGLVHSYKYDPILVDEARMGRVERHASLPSTSDNDQRKILLISHNRVRSRIGIEEYHYQGNPRSLTIWDESLLVSNHRAIERVDIASALGWLRPRAESNKTMAEALGYLDGAWDVLEGELKAQKDEDRDPIAVALPPLEGMDQCRFIEVLSGNPVLSPLVNLLEISQAPVRVVDANQGGGGYVKYDIAVPPELKNIAILDASFPIRDLEQMDPTIKADPKFDGNVKSYSRVIIHQMLANSGRGSMTESFLGSKEDRKVALEVVEVVKAIPQTEAVILFTFLPKRVKRPKGKGTVLLDMAEGLRENLTDAGIDIDAKVEVMSINPNGSASVTLKPRFVWLTWGSETSLSSFQYATNVIFAGVLHRSDVDLSGAIIGQSDNLLRDITHREVLKVRRSEIAQSLYQGLSRGSCRRTDNGEAVPMKAWLIHYDKDIQPLINKVMPGVVWKEWTPHHMQARTNIINDTAKKISQHLESLPSEVTIISTTKLKKELGLEGIAKRSFTCAIEEVNETSNTWRLVGRSMSRK